MLETDGIREENASLGQTTTLLQAKSQVTDMVLVVVGNILQPQVGVSNCSKARGIMTMQGRSVLLRVDLYSIRLLMEVGIGLELSFQVVEMQYGLLLEDAQVLQPIGTHTLPTWIVHICRPNLPTATFIPQATGLVSFLTDGPTRGY